MSTAETRPGLATLPEQLAAVRLGTEVFERLVEELTDGELTEPSGLPGWSRAHVTGHVARNADALVNLLTWARTGVETPMYRDAEQRNSEIESSAARPADALRRDLLDADSRLARDVEELPAEGWAAIVRTAQGREVPASEVAWMRIREVWIHAVDLDVGFGVDDFPAAIVPALVVDVVGSFARKGGAPPLALHAADLDQSWRLGAEDTPAEAEVSGRVVDLAAYLIGRPVPGPLTANTPDGSPPRLPAWL